MVTLMSITVEGLHILTDTRHVWPLMVVFRVTYPVTRGIRLIVISQDPNTPTYYLVFESVMVTTSVGTPRPIRSSSGLGRFK